MKARFFAALLCVVIPSSLALAEEESGPFISGGQAGGLFQFSGLASLGVRSFVPQGIGMKMYLNKVMAIRGNVAFATNTLSLPYSGTSGVDGSASATMFGAGGALEFHLTSKRVSPYLGAGINFAVNSQTLTNPAASSSGQTEYDNIGYGDLASASPVIPGASDAAANATTYGVPGLTLGIGAIAGVEYYIAKSISLAAEYNFGFSLTSLADMKIIPNASGSSPTTIAQGGRFDLGFGLFNAGTLTLCAYF